MHDFFVFFRQYTAGGVNEPPAGFQETRSALEDERLFLLELDDALRRMPPFKVGIAAQRPEPAARGVHQHAIYFSRKALDLGVVFVGNALRMDIAQARAFQARLEIN